MTQALCLGLGVAFLIHGVASAGTGETDARALVEGMGPAVERLTYEGLLVVRQGGAMDTLHVAHTHDEAQGSREHLVALTGPPREVFRNRNAVTCLAPRGQASCLKPGDAMMGLPGVLPLHRESAGGGAHYRFLLGEMGRVADLPCRQVRIQPLDQLRYGYDLCIHEDTGLPLSGALLDGEGAAMEQFLFTRISFPETLPGKRFEPAGHDGRRVQRLTADHPGGASKGGRDWRLEGLPPGFDLRAAGHRRMEVSSDPVQHLMLSDGLATVSIFIARSNDTQAEGDVRLMRSGPLHAASLMRDGRQVTVLGEVPGETVQRIARAIRFGEEETP
ncbi:MAG: MucB/RseB C-terminal domain-containing protein [Ectothiorhodospira sp.]